MATVSYKDAGVDIDAGNQFVENIKPYVKSTMIPGVLGGIGSFAGAFELPSGYKKPVILAGTDGVGTKLKLAIDAKKFDTVGIDLVAMCTNDLLCNFGEPLFFLDYYATAKLEVEEATQVVKGIAQGCIRSECALIGGETAEMPGMYKEGDFDLAGFCVGIAEKDELDRVERVSAGDVLIALPSSGVHSNGFSLVRKLLLEKLGMSLEDDFQGKKLKDVLLEPTRIYVKEFKANKDKIESTFEGFTTSIIPTPILNVLYISSSSTCLLINSNIGKTLILLLFTTAVKFSGKTLGRFSVIPPPVICAKAFILSLLALNSFT